MASAGAHENECYESTDDTSTTNGRELIETSSYEANSQVNANRSPDGVTVISIEANERPSRLENNLKLAIEDMQSEQNGLSIEVGEHKRDKYQKVTGSSRDEFVISWHNLDYVVESKWYKLASQRKPILNSLSGSFRSGQLSAILGPSGAGKSTFIDCLMGKHDRGLSGQTKVTFSESLEADRLARKQRGPLRIAMIPQEDHLLESLTVYETFVFASRLKNAHLRYAEEETNGDKQQKRPFDHQANVQRVINQLNLASCANLRCGKLSGGQYKRVSIGQELLSRPDLMILDEPTSGLDSVTCYQTINALRQLIETSVYPIAIVATIHQPDIEVFNLFHKAYVLASGGRAIYEGPVDQIFDTCQRGLDLVDSRRKQPIWQLASNANSASSLQDLAKQLEKRKSNPARLIVEVAANEYGFEIVGALNEIHYNQGQQQQRLDWSPASPVSCSSDSAQSTASSSDNLAANGQLATLDNKPHVSHYDHNDPSKRRAILDKRLSLNPANQSRSFWVYLKHLGINTQRSWLTTVRDPMLFSLQVVLHILVPLLISYSYQGALQTDACPRVGPLDVVEETYRQGNILDDLNIELRSVFENLGYMFFQIYVIIFAAVCVTSLTYPLVMHVLLKEYTNGWYSLSSYFLGRTLADLPVPTVNVVIAIAISYHLTGQPLSPYGWRFACVSLVTVLATLVAQTQGLMFGAMLMNAPQSAVFVAPASTAPLVVVSGFLFRIKTLPLVLQILSKFSYFTHLLNGFIVARYGFNRCPCSEQDFQIQLGHQVPRQARAIIDIWVETFSEEYGQASNQTSVDLVGKLVDTISAAKTFGFQMTDCSQVKPFIMLDFDLENGDLFVSIVALLAMLFCFRWLTYMVLAWKIRSCV